MIDYGECYYVIAMVAKPEKSIPEKSSSVEASAENPLLQKTNLRENKQNPSPEIKGIKRKIPEFLSRRWWTGVGVLAAIIISIIGLVVSGGFGRGVGCSQQIPQQSEEPSTEQTPQQSEEPSTEYKEHPSPSEIKDEIEKQPLLQQKNTGDSFIGLKVQWHLKLFSIFTSNSDPNVIKLDLVEGSRLYPGVSCNIDIREHPEIKRAKQGVGVFVKGEISKATGTSIDLINCTVKFD